jgi:type III secretion system YscD/HrpQ family protein
LLLSGLTIQFIIPGNGPNRPGLDLAAFESALRVAGFSSLLVAGDNGRAVVSGLVANLGDANKVRAIAAKQSYPVQVLVRDREEFIRALESILAGHGLFPQVRIDAEGATLLGYALDALVERAALSWARGGLPHFVNIRSGLLTRKDVEETLLAELARAGLSDTVSIDWQPGVVALAGPGADSPLLPGVIRAAREALRSPIAFQINSAAAGEQIYVGETASQEARPALLSPEAALSASLPGDPFGPSVSLRSVTPAGLADARTLPFITISDGRLYFVGGTLPSGYTLTGVYPDRLEFSKNNSPLAYKLQGR